MPTEEMAPVREPPFRQGAALDLRIAALGGDVGAPRR
jgi:hypothetical protein